MTELALLLESSTWENIIGTHHYRKALDRVEWMSSQVSEEVTVQVPFKKEHGKWSFRHSVNFSQAVVMQNEVLLHWCLVPRLSVDSVNLDVGWKKCYALGDTALESTLNLICWVHRQAVPDFQWLPQQHEVYNTLLSLAALFQAAGTALKLPTCLFHSTNITWKRLKQKQPAPEVIHIRRENNLNECKFRILWFVSP